jgi:hypothetical protein
MRIDSLVTYRGRPYYLRGIDPMSVTDRRAELEDAFTHERISVLLDDVVQRQGSAERDV